MNMEPERVVDQSLSEESMARRDALRKLGKLGLYAAPAIMVLANSRKAAAASVPPRPPT
jgi:hypothetical protein